MTEGKNDIEFHLQEALAHLEVALNHSIQAAVADDSAKKTVGRLWELFLGEFFRRVREKGKQARFNLLSLIRFPRF